MACAMNAAAMMVGVAPAQPVGAVSRSTTASKSSLLFNNGGLHVTKLAHSSRARTMQPLRVRAEDESIVDKVKGGMQDLSQKMKDAMPSGGNREGLSGPKRTDEEGYWFDTPSSTGDVTDKARQKASKSRTLDGEETESLQERLKDGVRTLRSKTGDVIYDATRNDKDVGNDATQKNIEAQTKYTKGL
ncbi:unnamed protein product [Sphagnum balticum]